MRDSAKQLWLMALMASQSGFVVVGAIVGGLWVDKTYGTGPWFSVLGFVGGFGAGILMISRLVRMGRREENVSDEKNK